jgi:hypothetical protein
MATGSWGYSASTGDPGHEEGPVDGVLVGRGYVEHQEIAWSDPRLPPTHWIRMDYAIHGTDEPVAMTVTTSHLLVGQEGSWRGTGRAVEADEGRYSTYELLGEGAYEGLYALLRGTPGADAHGPWDLSYEGLIFEGELPAFPEPAEPLDFEGVQHWPYPTDSPAED